MFDLDENLWSEILPGLFMGGTADDDTRNSRGVAKAAITPEHFDTVVTLYAFANPVDWYVKEIRLGFYDHHDVDVDLDDLESTVSAAYQDWQAGKRVLIRCQAGMNRSGLITALVLMRHGIRAKDAVELIRSKRGYLALSNRYFVNWLETQQSPSLAA